MVTIQVPKELAQRLAPLQERLPEIIELGLRQIEKAGAAPERMALKTQVWAALLSTGLVTLPGVSAPPARVRRAPLPAGGQPASEIIIEQRRK